MDDQGLIQLFITAVGNFGFPIAITSYLLLRFEKKIDMLNETIGEVADILRREAKK
ncbi:MULTISPECIES: YvrJ family protein [Paenibacillus]|uniref:YvrJ family protein n=2 Tax=Paenibacillus TaxID=44249 RepID=A0A2T6FS34_9BACL|nr:MULTISPECIES: YvrJ family protein [Paenibacillus]MDO3678627.1 YvrJ family protein [Paenibacillus ehimensis]PUA34712.1 YvrJ family protein [Paenibacillus elgii]